LYGTTIPENSKKSGKITKMGVRRALRARRTPIFGFFPGFSGIFQLDFFPYNTVLFLLNGRRLYFLHLFAFIWPKNKQNRKS